MKKDTFGDPNQFKMLDFLTEKIVALPSNKKEYISTLLVRFNWRIKQTTLIEDEDFRMYVLHLIGWDFKKITQGLTNKYDEDLISYLENFIHAKINNLKNGNI